MRSALFSSFVWHSDLSIKKRILHDVYNFPLDPDEKARERKFSSSMKTKRKFINITQRNGEKSFN